MPESNIELRGRIKSLAFLVLVFFLVLLSRLFQVQVVDHREYEERLDGKLTRTELFMSGRGRILTRDGRVLAHDAPSYQLSCRLSDLSLGDQMGILEEIHFYSNYRMKRYEPLRLDGVPRPDKEILLKKIDRLKPRLKRESIVLDLSKTTGVDVESLSVAVMECMENVVKRWAHLGTRQILNIYLDPLPARRLMDHPHRFSGFSCVESSIRHYPEGPLASHLVGYLGKLSEKNYHVLRVRGYYPPREDRFKPVILTDIETKNLSWVRNFLVGVSGVEWIFNDHLRGRLHEIKRRRDLSDDERPIARIDEGQDLVLTIDAELQELAIEKLSGRRGAVSLMDMDTGDVLVSASFPSYDPNLITPPVQVHYNQYIQSQPGMLIHRNFENHYPFGSVYKIVTAAAILEEGVAAPHDHVYCSMKHGRTGLKCLGYHGDIDVIEALQKSCNLYFYDRALELGPYKLFNWARRFGLGEPLGIGFPYEKGGVNPSPIYKRDRLGEMWYPGDTCHMAIGQGFQLGTPLQAAYVSALVSRNTPVAKPRLWVNGKITKTKLTLKPSTREAVREGMFRVVNLRKGTAHGSVSEKVVFSGKTGTADVYKKEPHAWFSGYAPHDHPKVAISVIVEHGGHGGDEAAPIAKSILEAWQGKYGRP